MIVPGSPNTALMAGKAQYRIGRSLRFRASVSAWLTRTPATQTEYRKFTYSTWVKRGSLVNTAQTLFGAGIDNGTFGNLYFDSDSLRFAAASVSSTISSVATNALFRDTSAYMHVLFGFDSTQAIDSNRLWFEVNGIRQVVTASMWPGLNNGSYINNANLHAIGVTPALPARGFDGLQAEINFIDGQALTSSSFGEIDLTTGVWMPKKYLGTYGTNGFYLDFADNSAATAITIGKDRSGNSNDWTPNNISVAAGATNDSFIDSPTNYDDGVTGRGNYATLNPLSKQSTITLTNGNLTITGSGHGTVVSSIPVLTGKWYAEFTWTSWGGAGGLGITANQMEQSGANSIAGKVWLYDNGGSFNIINGTVVTALGGGRMATGQVWHVAYDADTGKVYIGFNGAWLDPIGTYTGNPATGANPTATLTAFIGQLVYFMPEIPSGIMDANFGQRPFAYAPPAGFKAINTQNLPTPSIPNPKQYFDIRTRIGTGAVGAISDLAFSPAMVWSKGRSTATSHGLIDKVRGATKTLSTSNIVAESADTNGLTAFNVSGYSFGSSAAPDGYDFNTAGRTFVDWIWQSGVIPGFDIVLYTGDGTAGTRTIPHGLGVVPSVIMTSRRSVAGEWPMYHKGLPATNTPYVNATYNPATYLSRYDPAGFTSSVFKLGANSENNANGVTQVAYLWAEIQGFSKFGTYGGNGLTDGPFVWCGFRPRIVFTKRTDSTGSWVIHDSARDPVNQANAALYPNLANAEGTSFYQMDLLSGGFKIRNTDAETNAAGGSFIYMAFAENPFKYARAR